MHQADFDELDYYSICKDMCAYVVVYLFGFSLIYTLYIL